MPREPNHPDPAAERYSRQTILPDIGADGQRRLFESHALIVGCGALGSAAAEALCRAGVGFLTIIDRDFVEPSNLQRQTLFTEADAAKSLPKAEAARRALARLNSDVAVRAVVDDFSHRNAESFFPSPLGRGARGEGSTPPTPPPVHVILDGTDNFETRYLINDAAVKLGVPYIYAGVVGTRAMTATFLPCDPSGQQRIWALQSHERERGDKERREESSPSPPTPLPDGEGWQSPSPLTPLPGGEGEVTPCLRCVFDQPPAAGSAETCETAGVLGPAVTTIAGLQTAEALKCLLGLWRRVNRDLVEIDPWSNTLRRLDLRAARRRDCPCCGRGEFAHLTGETSTRAASLCGRGAVQIRPPEDSEGVNLDAIADRLARLGEIRRNEHLVRCALPSERSENDKPVEITVFRDGRTIIKGAGDEQRARSIHARYVGM